MCVGGGGGGGGGVKGSVCGGRRYGVGRHMSSILPHVSWVYTTIIARAAYAVVIGAWALATGRTMNRLRQR